MCYIIKGSYKYGSNTVVRIALRLYVMISLAPLQYVCKQQENGADICEGQKTVQTFVEGWLTKTHVICELKLYEYTLYSFLIGFILNSVTIQLSYHIITKKVA